MADAPEKLGKSGSVNHEALQEPPLPGRASSVKARRRMPKTVREGFMVRFGRRKYGRSFFHSRYFVLRPGLLAYYKKRPSDNDIPIRSLSLDANCRVEDRGMKHHHNNVVYVLSIYNKADKSNNIMMASIQLHETISWKEDIERVIEQSPLTQPINGTTQGYRSESRGVVSHERSASASDSELKGSMLQEDEKFLGYSHAKISDSSGFLVDLSNEPDTQCSDPTLSDITNDGKHWRLVRCQNGLRIFEEITDDLTGYTRAMKAVGVVEAQCENIFSLIMGMDETRNKWDSTFHNGMMVTEIDGHMAILYHRLQLGWCSWLVWPRDLCYKRYWRRIENGTYVVLFRSTEHPDCPPQPGCVRAHIESGGFRISPLKPRLGCPRARVEHQIQIDLQGWGVNYLPLLQYHCLVQMLNSVAGLREWFSQCENAQLIPQFNRIMPMEKPLTTPISRQKRKASVKDSSAFTQPQEEVQGDDDESEDEDEGTMALDEPVVKESEVIPSTVSTSEVESVDSFEWPTFPSTVSQDGRDSARNAYSIPHSNNFRVRSRKFPLDRSKIVAGESLMQLVAVDWFKYPERMDHLARRNGCAAQVAAEKGLFTVLFNLQVPGSTHYSMVLYFVAKRAIPGGSLLQKFIDGDDGFRNNRLKLIPSVPKGSWVVRQSVGSTPCILGKAVDCNYYRGKKYLEVDVDIGSSTVASGVLGLVFGVVATLVVDMAFLVQGNSVDELPERLIGTVRISRLELSKAVSPYTDKDSIES